MTDYKNDLDEKVTDLAPYRDLADDGAIEIRGKKYRLGSSDNLILSNGEAYLMSSNEVRELKLLDEKIAELKKETLLPSSSNMFTDSYIDDFFEGALLYGAWPTIIASTSGWVAGITTAVVCGLVDVAIDYFSSRASAKERLSWKEQEKQQFLENLIK